MQIVARMDIQKVDQIFLEVQKLGKTEQIILLKKLNQLIKEGSQHKNKVTLTDLRGLGGEIWRDTDVNQYLDDERQW